MISFGLALLALVLLLVAARSPRHRESRVLGAGVALTFLAGAVWNAYRKDRWWMLVAGLIVAVMWILFDSWRECRRPRHAP